MYDLRHYVGIFCPHKQSCLSSFKTHEQTVCRLCPNLQVPDKDEFSQSKRQMLARIDVCMGGKVAEEVIFGNDAVTSGSTSDLKHATELARHMVTECGMSEELGKPQTILPLLLIHSHAVIISTHLGLLSPLKFPPSLFCTLDLVINAYLTMKTVWAHQDLPMI